MTVLGLEFSSPHHSIALLEWRGGAMKSIGESVEIDYRQTTALAQLDQLLRSVRIEPDKIDCIAVGLGPGSYTGIRSALAIAQGWQLAREVKVYGASSAEAIALTAAKKGACGHAQVIIDAQRNELYVEDYELGDPLRLLHPLRIESLELWRATKAPHVIGPEISKWDNSEQVVFPTAQAIAELALSRGDFLPAEKLAPIYLRATNFVKAPPPRTVT